MSELGELLKATREEQKKAIQDVVENTRIREKFIEIIEDGNFKELPSYLHAYGFVKKYAEFLNLDYENVVWPLFTKECPKEHVQGQENEIDQEKYTPSTTETSFLENGKNSNKRPVVIILSLVVLLLIIYGGYYMYSKNYVANVGVVNSSVVDPIPATVVETETAVIFMNDNMSDNNTEDNHDAISNDLDNTANGDYDNTTKSEYIDPLFTQTIPTPVVLSPEKVTVRFSENCWFKYDTDKGNGREINAKRGTKIDIEFDKSFNIEIGNAVAVSMEYNGKEYSNFGSRNVVRVLHYEARDGRLELVRK